MSEPEEQEETPPAAVPGAPLVVQAGLASAAASVPALADGDPQDGED